MNTIAALIRTQPQNAETVVENLAELFRQSLGEGDEMVALREEMQTARQYMEIEAFRLGDRLQVEWDIDDIDAGVRVPRLLLQPLLENAVYYGIEPLTEGGLVRIACHMKDKQVDITIENPLVEAKTSRSGNSMAMDNIRSRLNYLYGTRGQLYLLNKDDRVSVILSFPSEI